MNDKEQQLQALALEVYKEHRYFQPLYPWVLVRVLPKSQTYKGMLILPEKQNKTVHEGIILTTWKPYVEQKWSKQGVNHVIRHCSEFVAGDHVVFPHWSGLPIPGYDEDLYRIVKEEGNDKDGCIFAKIEQTESSQSILRQLLSDWNIADEIEKRFVLVDKEQQAVTMSGV